MFLCPLQDSCSSTPCSRRSWSQAEEAAPILGCTSLVLRERSRLAPSMVPKPLLRSSLLHFQSHFVDKPAAREAGSTVLSKAWWREEAGVFEVSLGHQSLSECGNLSLLLSAHSYHAVLPISLMLAISYQPPPGDSESRYPEHSVSADLTSVIP